MLQAGIASFIVLGLMKLFERGEDRGIDGFVSFAFVIVPTLIMFLIGLAVGIFELPEWLTFLGPIFYFAIPLLMLKYQFELGWSRSAGYASAVLIAVVVTEVAFMYLLGGEA
jgi:uncharacterized membrane protein YhdT